MDPLVKVNRGLTIRTNRVVLESEGDNNMLNEYNLKVGDYVTTKSDNIRGKIVQMTDQYAYVDYYFAIVLQPLDELKPCDDLKLVA